ncbi:MAG: 3'(2'),5'-bisphosphate nucleotidase [Anaerolineaceae bacterium]|nr:3'(2'),5'-bisphosphate nucleotidase [Anaerolineaceae bacterium]
MTDLTPTFTAIRQAVSLCETIQRNHLSSSDKGANDPVTIADYGAQAIICRAISQAYPADGVVAEEQGEQFLTLVPEPLREKVCQLLSDTLGVPVTQSDVVRWLDFGRGHETWRRWLIDPIDGTKGFLARRHYAIAAGLVQDGQPIGAVVATPGYGDHGAVFWALDGKTTQQGLNGEAPVQVQVSSRMDSDSLRVVQSVEKAHGGGERMARVLNLLDIDANQVTYLDSMEKYALVAAGEADMYLRLPKGDSVYQHKAWDHAAGAALVLAAGGKVTDMDGSPLDFSAGAILPNKGMVVTNGAVHDRVLAAVQQAIQDV